MRGTMLWFNADKGYGFIRTDHDERLYVDRSGFLPDHQPAARCKGRAVTFERAALEGDIRAVEVAFVAESDTRRARLRRGRGGSPL